MGVRKNVIWQIRGQKISLSQKTVIMGILNITPDSFSGDGVMTASQTLPLEAVLKRAQRMVKEGADVIDVGGESTRPGAYRVSIKEELMRVVPVVKLLSQKLPVPVSVDTSKPAVAKEALEAGASILNVVEGTPINEKLIALAKRYKAGLVLMHMRGTPRTMQMNTRYRDLIGEITSELKQSVDKCLRSGINKTSIVVDPGIGFGKSAAQNLALIKRLKAFHALGCPVLIGTSRKSFIGKVLGVDVKKRIWGTTASVVAAIHNGAHIVRVHDVKEIKQAALVADAITRA